MTHEDMSIDDIVEDFEHPEFNPERELSMGIIDLLPEESEPGKYYLEQELPVQRVLKEIEHPEDARYFINPEFDEVTRAIENVQLETPAERDARYQRDLDRLEVEEAIGRQRHEDEEKPAKASVGLVAVHGGQLWTCRHNTIWRRRLYLRSSAGVSIASLTGSRNEPDMAMEGKT